MSTAFLIKQIFWGVLIPATVSGVVFLALRRFLGLWVSTVGIALGYFLAHRALYGLKDFSPNLPMGDWLPYIALIALLWMLTEKLWWHFRCQGFIAQGFAWARWLMRLLLLEMMATRFFWTKLTHRLERFRWEWYESAFYLAMVALLGLAIWFSLEQRSLRDARAEKEAGREGAILPSALLIYTAFLSVSALFSHSGIGAQQLGILTATIGAIMLLCWLSPAFRLPVPAVGVISLMVIVFLLNAFFFADMPWYTVLLFTVAPVTLLVPLAKLSFASRTAIRLGLMAVPTLLATALTFFLLH